MADIQRALEIAVEAHKGQVQKNGSPYVLHPLTLMTFVDSAEAKMAAILHDVVEDTSITLDDLSKEGFHPDVIEAIDALTKRPGENRMEAANRAVVNPIARMVKLADVTDNMDLSRISEPSDKDFKRLKEYVKVKKFLLEHN